MPGLHHVAVWVADVSVADAEWGWLLHAVGFERTEQGADGNTWSAGDGPYLTLTTSPSLSRLDHDRRAPGVNHFAFLGGTRAQVDAVMASASANGWRPLYQERYPVAGGPSHYAGWLESSSLGFKAEIVATEE